MNSAMVRLANWLWPPLTSDVCYMYTLAAGGNLSSKIAQNRVEGRFFSEEELKQLLRHVALVSSVAVVSVQY